MPASIYRNSEGQAEILRLYDEALSRLGIGYESKTVSSRYGETHVHSFGPEDAPPIAFFHGGNFLNVRWANVILDDHYASDEINGGVNEGQGFDGAFPGETEGPNLGELRSIFQRKSFVRRQEKLFRALLAGGRTPAELVQMQVGDLPPTDEAEKYLKRRAELGLDVSPGAPLIVDPDGSKVPEEAVVEHLRFARTVRVSIEGNAGLCRGLLTTRYGLGEKVEVKR